MGTLDGAKARDRKGAQLEFRSNLLHNLLPQRQTYDYLRVGTLNIAVFCIEVIEGSGSQKIKVMQR